MNILQKISETKYIHLDKIDVWFGPGAPIDTAMLELYHLVAKTGIPMRVGVNGVEIVMRQRD